MMLSEPGAERLTEEEKRRGKRLTESESPLLAAYLQHRLKVVEAQIRGLKSTDGANPELLSRAEADAAYYREEIRKL